MIPLAWWYIDFTHIPSKVRVSILAQSFPEFEMMKTADSCLSWLEIKTTMFPC